MKNIFWSLIALALVTSVTSAQGKTQTQHKRETSITIEDVVRRVDPDGENYRVAFQKHAAPYVLRKETPTFNQILAKLMSSQAMSQKIRLKVDPNTLEITGLAK